MRHQVSGRHLGRTSAHRKALRRNLAASLFEHGTISTTREKAKFVKPFAEKLITLARNGSLHARRHAIALLQDRAICKIEDGRPVKVGSVIQKLFSEIGPQFAQRNGGYTRIINLPLRRIGDNSQLVLLQLVGDMKPPQKATEPPTVQVATAQTLDATEPVEEDETQAQDQAPDEEADDQESSEEQDQEKPETS